MFFLNKIDQKLIFLNRERDDLCELLFVFLGIVPKQTLKILHHYYS